MKFRLNLPPNIDKLSGEPVFKELRMKAEEEIDKLDDKIDEYVDELMEMLLPVNASELEETNLRKLLENRVRLTIYSEQLSKLFYQINSNKTSQFINHRLNPTPTRYATTRGNLYVLGKKSIFPNYLSNDTKKLLINKAPAQIIRPSEDKRFQRRYTVKPNSPDLKFKRDSKHVEEEFMEVKDMLSPMVIKNFFHNYPHLKTVVELRDFIYNSGNLETLPLSTSLFRLAEKQVYALREALIEKTMIADNNMDKFIELKNKDVFSAAEQRTLLLRYIIGAEKVRRIVFYAKQNLVKTQETITQIDISNQFNAFVNLNSARLNGISNDPAEIKRVTNKIIADAAIDLSQLGDKSAIKALKKDLTSQLEDIVARNNQEKYDSPTEKYKRIRQEETRNAAIATAGFLALTALSLTMAFTSKEAQELRKSQNSEKAWRDATSRPKIIEQVENDSANELKTEGTLEIKIPDKDGNEITVSIQDPAMITQALEDNTRENDEAMAELEALVEIPYISKPNTHENQTSYIPKHSAKENQTTPDKSSVTRHRRSDKYKDYKEEI